MTTLLPITRRIRNLQRYAEVLSVLVSYGFGDLIQELKLDRLLERGLSLVGVKHKEEAVRLTRAARIRKAMEELGPTFIKLGQVLSTRPDLVPQEWVDEFKKLQDDVPPLPFEVIRQRLQEEFPGRLDELFKVVNPKPLAAASMAQAHRATLQDGTEIVLKVLRPGIQQVTETDMEILRALAQMAESHFNNLGFSPGEVVKEFARELAREVDMAHEGRATDRLRLYFEEDEGVVFPEVHWEASTRNVLALEEIHGILLSRVTESNLSKEDRRRVVENGARAVFRQCLEIGFFHADPHPGNLFALPGGRIAFIDCGMTGELDSKTTQQLANLVQGVVSGDSEKVISVVGALADVEPDKLEDRVFRADIRSFVSNFEGVPLERLDFGYLLNEFFARLRVHRIRCPADLILLIKALTTIQGVARDLDPTFEMIPFARPYVERMVERQYGFTAVRKRIQRTLLQYTELAEDLPREIRPILAQLRKNKLAVNLEHKGLHDLTRTIEHASRNIAFSLIIAAMLIGSSILVLAAQTPGLWVLTALGIAGFVVAAVMTVLIVISNRRGKWYR